MSCARLLDPFLARFFQTCQGTQPFSGTLQLLGIQLVYNSFLS